MRSGVRLGIDVGVARIGVSRSDPAGVLAVPVETLHLTKSSAANAANATKGRRSRNSSKKTDKKTVALSTLAALDHIVVLVAEYEVLEVVVGYPVGLSGRKGPAAALVDDFVVELANKLPNTPVRLLDERLSTVQAQQNLQSSGISTRQGRSMIDQAAAVIILQTALDAERSTGVPVGSIVGRP